MNSLFRLLTIVILGIGFENGLAQTDYSVPMVFEFNQTTLNRAIYQQYSAPAVPKTATTTINGESVTFAFTNRPVAEISDALYLRFLFSISRPGEYGNSVENYQIRVPFLIESVEWNTDENDAIEDGAYLSLNGVALNNAILSLPITTQLQNFIVAALSNPGLNRFKILDQKFDSEKLNRFSDFNDFKVKSLPSINCTTDGTFKLTLNTIFSVKQPTYNLSIEVKKIDNENPGHYHLKITTSSNVKFTVNTISLRIDGLIFDWTRIINQSSIQDASGNWVTTTNYNTYNSTNNQPQNVYLKGDDRIQHIYLNLSRGDYFSNVEWVRPAVCSPGTICETLTELQYLNGATRTFYEK